MDVPARRLIGPRSAPGATVALLTATLVLVAAALAVHARGDIADTARTSAFLWLFTALFLVRVVGQVVVLVAAPPWLPPAGQWNLLPYRLLLPLQVVLLVAMAAVSTALSRGGQVAGGHGAGRAIVVVSLGYASSMAIRYAVQMSRRPEERWWGGTIPIVFHGVLAAWLYVLGTWLAG